jgi:GNAT superfamily N-acetyltransferase
MEADAGRGRTEITELPMTVMIDTFRPEHAAAFDALNRAWLVAYGLLEPADELHLTDPVGHILDPGGQIYVALENQVVIGTCALVPHGPEVFEVAKLAVSPAARGRGVGRQLVDACLAFARRRGARQAVLLSSSRLGSALRLYAEVGFRSAPVPPDTPYVTADVYMELDLVPGVPAG